MKQRRTEQPPRSRDARTSKLCVQLKSGRSSSAAACDTAAQSASSLSMTAEGYGAGVLAASLQTLTSRHSPPDTSACPHGCLARWRDFSPCNCAETRGSSAAETSCYDFGFEFTHRARKRYSSAPTSSAAYVAVTRVATDARSLWRRPVPSAEPVRDRNGGAIAAVKACAFARWASSSRSAQGWSCGWRLSCQRRAAASRAAS